MLMPLSDKACRLHATPILTFDMLKHGQKCLDNAVNNSRLNINNLAGRHERLSGPAAEQLRRQLMFKEHLHLPYRRSASSSRYLVDI
jgi:hypothetical protein